MLSEKIVNLLNDQINKELYSAYLYLELSNYYADQNLKGFAHWYYVQTQEELAHAMIFRNYLIREGYPVHLETVEKPKVNLTCHLDPLKVAYEHELYVTSTIHNIYAAAQEERDYRTVSFIDWFVKEQAEEEDNTKDLVQRYEMFGEDKKSLYLLDSELGSRTFTPPTPII